MIRVNHEEKDEDWTQDDDSELCFAACHPSSSFSAAVPTSYLMRLSITNQTLRDHSDYRWKDTFNKRRKKMKIEPRTTFPNVVILRYGH